jgi:hypothetical protein
MKATVSGPNGAQFKGAHPGMAGVNPGNAPAVQDEVGEKPGVAGPQNTTFVVADGVTAYVDNASQPSGAWNVRNFGRFSGKVSVSYLTAQSAGDVVNFTNTVILRQPNHGVNCGNQAARQIALRNCTLFGTASATGPFSPTATAVDFNTCVQQAGCSIR